MTTKLSDWLPILQHPKVGKRICEAAGVRLEKDAEGVAATELWFPGYGGLVKSSELFGWQVTAIAHGVLSVMGEGLHIQRVYFALDRWVIDLVEGAMIEDPILSAAIFAAARRVWLGGV